MGSRSKRVAIEVPAHTEIQGDKEVVSKSEQTQLSLSPPAVDHLANIEMLASLAFKSSLETFDSAYIDAVTPLQTVAMKREAAAMSKSYAASWETRSRRALQCLRLPFAFRFHGIGERCVSWLAYAPLLVRSDFTQSRRPCAWASSCAGPGSPACRRLVAGEAPEIPALAQRVVTGLADQIGALQVQLAKLEKELLAWHRSNELSQRLATIPGVGVISATALAASVIEPELFRSGRQFAASLGLTPLQNCSGGKERMGRISRMGDRYLRRLLVVGMTSLVRRARARPETVDPRLPAMLQRKPARLVTVAAANRTARVAWAIMTRGGTYRSPLTPQAV